MELRITSGKFKNKKLKVAKETKPVRERVKLAVFSIIGQKSIYNSKVLDLFAGSGNLGYEALSRGAGECTFVDNNYEAIKVIRENALNLGYYLEKSDDSTLVKVLKDEATKFVYDTNTHYDVVFIDPPYGVSIIHILKNLDNILSKNGTAIYFHEDKKFDYSKINSKLKNYDTRTYGITNIDFIVKK